jgi:hypothetical protein
MRPTPQCRQAANNDDRHRNCIFLQTAVHVRLNMSEANSDQALSTTPEVRPRYTGERLLRERPKIYRQVVRLLGEGWSANKICKWCHVTRETVRAVERREAVEVSERKKSIIGILGNVAELGASRMEETIGAAGLRDAAIGTGIAVDKMLALTGQTPIGIQIANIRMPTPEEQEETRRAHHALDEITRLLHKPEPLTVKEELMVKTQLCVLSSGRDAA